ncbi:MAG: porin [Holophaga sp.]|jgi:predicted porin
MKKNALVLLALCAGIPLLAQAPGGLTLTSASGDSSLQLYGILDAGVGRVSHSFTFDSTFPVATNPQNYAHAPASSVTGMYNGGISQTRWGLRGSSAIDGDFKAIFTLESALDVTSGQVSNGALGIAQNTAGTAAQAAGAVSADTAINGQLFSRSAFFGVSSDQWGTLTAGRHMSFMLDTIPGYDALQGAQLFTPIGFSGSYGGGGVTDNSRVDSSLKYKVKVNDFNFGYLHKFGGVSGSSTSRNIDEVIVGYESGPFGIQVIYQGCKDATSIANNASYSSATDTYSNVGTLKVTFYDTNSTMALVRYKAGDLALKGGYQRQTFSAPSDPAGDQTLTSLYGQPVAAWNVNPFKGVGSQKVLSVWWLGAAYDLTKKLNLAVSYYHVGQNDFSNGTGAANPADTSGTSKFESALLDYRFTKAFDLYAGYMANQVSGGLGAGYDFAQNNVLGGGARFSF